MSTGKSSLDTPPSELGPETGRVSSEVERTQQERAQRVAAELVREAVKDKLAATHQPIPLGQFQKSVRDSFDRVAAGERLLVLRKLEPVACVEPIPDIIPDLPRVWTGDIPNDRGKILAQLAEGQSFIVERSNKPGPGNVRHPAGLLLPPPELTEAELAQLEQQVTAALRRER
jgi:hypothetical protein